VKSSQKMQRLNLLETNDLLRCAFKMIYSSPHRLAKRYRPASFKALIFIASCAIATGAAAQAAFEKSTASKATGWQQCSALRSDSVARLQCFDRWAAEQTWPDAPSPVAQQSPKTLQSPQGLQATAPVLITMTAPEVHNCKNPRFSELSRYWELEAGSDCGTFGIRGYQPISLSWIGSDSVNTQPTSPSPDHTAESPLSFKNSELRIGLSVRTKIAQGLLTQNEPLKRDSVWFAYSQESNWQILSGDLSRPFRTTDHQPELIYIYPLEAPLPWGWQLRYAGLSLNHQSNGQPLPLSRSWNRTMLLAGMEKNQAFYLFGKLWYRTPEDAKDDDNPDISDLIGRAELAGYWHVNPDHTLGVTLRHSLRANGNGSVRLEWLRNFDHSGFVGNNSGLRLHTQLFSGYGDSLVDYNRRRTVLSVGLSLVDW